MRLVADVGGTNTRLALSETGIVFRETLQSYRNADWDNLGHVIASYLSAPAIAAPSELVVAVAGPVHGRSAVLTNRNWEIDADHLMTRFGCDRAALLNDLTALGYSVPGLRPDQLRKICDGTSNQLGISQSLVVGIGTGFNVSPVLQGPDTLICPVAEAGHVSMPNRIASELSLHGIEPGRFATVEELFSGRGFAEFCRHLTGQPTLEGTIAMASYGASGADEITRAIDAYSALLGWLLRDLSLAYMAFSGIYLAGSVGRSVVAAAPGPCTQVLTRPCRIRNDANAMLWTIEDDGAALSGCAGFSQF